MAETADSNADRIVKACDDNWDAYKSDCSGFVRAVAHALGIELSGLADDLVTAIQGEGWTDLGHDGVQAKQKAEEGNFVVAGLKGSDQAAPSAHGHVVVIVPGSLAHGKYPTGYWGKLHGTGKKKFTINWAWKHADLPNVVYGSRQL
jgi:cell wall-associated NlpC family hydrolase